MSLVNNRKRRKSRHVLAETLEKRWLMSVTPVVLGLDSTTPLSTTNEPSVSAGIAVQLRSLANNSTTGAITGGTTFSGTSTPTNSVFEWNFGDTGMSSNSDYAATGPRLTQNTAVGFNAAHIYDTPGTYTVTLTTIDNLGTTASTSIPVSITSGIGSSASDLETSSGNAIYVDSVGGSDTANNGLSPSAPFQSYAHAILKLQQASAGSITQLRFKRGDTFTVSTSNTPLNISTSVLFGAYGTYSGVSSNPVLQYQTGTTRAFDPGASAANWTFQDLTFQDDSGKEAIAFEPKGSNMSFRECQFENFQSDFETNASTVDGMLIQGCTDTTQVAEYIYYLSGTDLVVTQNTFTGMSEGQPYLRFDSGTTFNANIAVYDNTVSCDYTGQSTDLTVRGLDDFVYVSDNDFYEGHVSYGNAGASFVGSPSYNSSSSTADENYLVLDSNRIDGDYVQVMADTSHVMIRNNVDERFAGDGDSGASLNFEMNTGQFQTSSGYSPGYTDLELINNTASNTYNGNSGVLYNVDNGGSGITFENNLGVDSNVSSGSYPKEALICASTSAFTAYGHNVWYDPSGTGSTSIFNVSGTVYSFNSFPSALKSTDTSANVTFAGDTSYTTTTATLVVSSTNDQVDSRVSGAILDFYGNARPTTGVFAGAVQGPPAVPLVLNATQSSDSIHLVLASDGKTLDVYQDAASSPATYTLTAISNIIVNAGADNEALTVDWSAGDCLPSGGLSFNGGTGTNTFRLVGASGTNSLTFNTGSLIYGPSIGTPTTMTYNGSTSALFTPSSTGDNVLLSGGTLTVPSGPSTTSVNVVTLASLNISSSAKLVDANPPTHAGRNVLLLGYLADQGTLDANGNDLDIRNAAVAAGTLANFTGGNGTSAPDQFPGSTGSGWATAWTTPTYGDTVTSATVPTSGTSPTPGGGNYLSFTDNAGSGGGLGGASRAYNSANSVNTGLPYQVQFDYRLDSGLSQMTTSNDRLAIFGDSTAIYGTTSTNTWAAETFGTAYGSVPAMTWQFTQGNQSGGVTSYVNTGVALVQSDTYHFTITVDPSSKTYIASITGDGASYTSAPLEFRSSTNFNSSTSTYVNFTDRHNASGGSYTWSLDTLNVTQTPAEAIAALAALGYNYGNWNGTGLISSAAGSDTSHLTTLGVVANFSGGSELFGAPVNAQPNFDGAVNYDTDVLVKFTYYGDDNLSGAVDGSDYSLFDQGDSSQSGSDPLAGWYYGDFNYSGTIDSTDASLQDNAFNNQGSPL